MTGGEFIIDEMVIILFFALFLLFCLMSLTIKHATDIMHVKHEVTAKRQCIAEAKRSRFFLFQRSDLI